MHNLALALHDDGHQVTGSDDQILEPSRSRLDAEGLLPEAEGWFPERITAELDVVILGMHARTDNPELLAAQALGLSVQSYPEFLFHATEQKKRVVIGGSHGKTTVTSMVLHVLQALGRPTDFMVGAQLEGFDRMVSLSQDRDLAVFEGDEYLSSPIDRRPKFFWYRPHVTLLTGIAWDHINVFPTEANYVEQFAHYLTTVEAGGTVVYCEEDAPLDQLVQTSGVHAIPYRTPQWETDGGTTTLHFPDGGTCRTELVGTHNFQNLAGARALCAELGVARSDFDRAISSFQGAARRLQPIQQGDHVVVYRDFAHAPSKVKATTDGVRASFPGRRLLACFELHTFSSLNRDFLPTYAHALDAADEAVVYFDPDVIQHKRLPELQADFVRTCFQRPDLRVITSRKDLESLWATWQAGPRVVLLMSSGWFSGAEWPVND
jgi:UDP-N-acetylmuramate: L-alanyl-gamma-D-glutamyl-meso-diaminopimelate ligase